MHSRLNELTKIGDSEPRSCIVPVPNGRKNGGLCRQTRSFGSMELFSWLLAISLVSACSSGTGNQSNIGGETTTESNNGGTASHPPAETISALGTSQSSDASPPKVIIRSPVSLAINNLGSATFSVMFDDNIAVASSESNLITPIFAGNAFCNHVITGSGRGSDPALITFTYCTGDGSANIAVPAGAAKDSSGNISELTVSVGGLVVDNSAPNLNLMHPSSGFVLNSENSGSPLFGSCESGFGVSLGGEVPAGQRADCVNGFFRFSSWSVNVANFIVPRSLFVTQSDQAGNVGTSAPITVSLNRFVPSAPMLPASHVVGLSPTFTGSCDPTAEHVAVSSIGAVRRLTCDTSGVLTTLVHLPAGGANFSLTLTSTNYAGSISSVTNFTRTPFKCPPGYVGVPRSGIAGLGSSYASANNPNWWLNVDKDFCIMKYPAKNNHNSTYASSTMHGVPWTTLRGEDATTSGSAFKACSDSPIFGVLGEYRLLSNTHWQTVVRNAESVQQNWIRMGSNADTGGFRLSCYGDALSEPSEQFRYSMPRGAIYAGGSSFESGLQNSTDDDPYFDTFSSQSDPFCDNLAHELHRTGPSPDYIKYRTSGSEQKRTLKLSNLEIVWDFGGNVYQSVSDNISDLGITPAITGISCTNYTTGVVCSPPAAGIYGSGTQTNDLIFGRSTSSSLFNLFNYGSGIYGSSSGTKYLSRGGAGAAQAGPFGAALATADSNQGFRCAFLPQ